jgi:hypothetical protein
MELNTGTITADEMEDEVTEIARVLSEAGSHVVLLTYGFGCSFPGLDPTAPDPLKPYIDIPVATALLPEFIERAEENGLFRMGRSDLFFKSDDGRTSFLLCEFSDIHCETEDAGLYQLLHDRWREVFPGSYATEREMDRYRLLSEQTWQPFSGGHHGRDGGGADCPN